MKGFHIFAQVTQTYENLMNTIKRIAVFVLLLWASSSIYGQLSKVHYIPPISITSQVANSFPFAQYIYISTPSESEVSYVIKPIGQASSFYEYGTVSNDSPVEFGKTYNPIVSQTHNTPLVILESFGSTVLNNKGYVIEAEKPIYVSVRFQSEAQSGAIVSKGNAALSKSFVFGGFVNDVSSGNTPFNSFFSVMATEDNTDISIDFPKSVVLANYTGSYPVTIRLQKHQSYVGILQRFDGANNLDGLIGGKLNATKDVVVTSGSTTGTNGPGRGHDFGIDQLVGIEKAGEEFIFIRGESPEDYYEIENVILIPLTSSTTYEINGGTPQPISGDYIVIEGDKFSGEGNMYVKTSAPVMAFQGIGGVSGSGNHEPNQGMFVVPPLSCAARGDINNIPYINRIGLTVQQGGLGIVAEKGKEVTLNGVPLTNGQPVEGNTNYVTYRISPLTDDLYHVSSLGELYVSYYTYSGAATSGAFYSGFQSPPEFTFDLDLVALGTCVQNNLTLNATNTNTLDSFGWWYNPSQNADSTQWQEITANAEKNSLTPSQAGWYQLRGTFSCGANTDELRSQAVFVGNCPDDTDNDGVVDNLDLDEDNDGILDSIESGGNIIPDFTDLNNPPLPIVTDKNISIASTYKISASMTLDASGTLSGDNMGNITSTLKASTEAINTYELNFTKPSTVRVIFPVSHSYIENEIITLSTTSANKTISLINTSEELLVDTNYDDAFESSVEYFTNNRVSVKYAPNVTTLSNTEFVGSALSNITITHKLGNITENSVLNFQVQIIDHPIDTDGDNVSDLYDLDSDKDGCFDAIEAGNDDPDNDGLLGTSPILFDPSSGTSTADIRGRVVFTGYDFNYPPSDNDNNGTYDFQEVGTPATLSQDFSTTSASLCEGESLTLTFKSTDAENVLWEIDNDADGIFESANTLGTMTNNGGAYTFEIANVTTALNQAVFRARIDKKTYACTTNTKVFTLTVNNNSTKPNLDPLTIVCKGATVADLDSTLVWYSAATGGSPLADNTVLVHNTPYFAASVVRGCTGKLRSETKVVVNDPVISTASGNATFCAEETITLSLDTNKILPAPDDFARINNLVYIENDAGPVQYDNGFYYTQKGIETGVQPITWPAAKALGESIVGATMYIINSTTEEGAVFQGLQHMGLTGNDGVAFWLGLFQDQSASDYLEPDGGWYWVDGTPLTYQNWWNSEPNDWPSDSTDGEENHAQFEFSNNREKWNDMGLTNNDGQSYPIFEYKAQTNIEWFTVETNGMESAIAGAANSSQLKVSPAVTTSYFARITTNGIVCDSEKFTITINPLPMANPVSDPIEDCVSNNNGAIPSTDLKGSFDLTSVKTTILGSSQSDTNHTVAFYTTEGGAENDITATKIITPKTYTNTSNPQTIYYRVTNADTNCVSDVAKLTIKAQALPPTLTIPDFEACDDLTSSSDKDGVLRFDLTSQTTAIEKLLGSTTRWSISYHKTVADAEAKNAISEYTTSVSDNSTKTIIVRLEDNTTGCYRIDNTLKLVVLELPEIKKSSFLREQCDTDTDGVVQDNLTLYNSYFSNNHTNETFTYYWDSGHTDEISTPSRFFNIDDNGNPIPDVTVYIKIKNDNGCERTFDPATGDPLTITLRVRTSEIKTSFLKDYYTCLDPSIKTNTGIGKFSKDVFADLKNELIKEHPTFSNNNVTIQFYENESDAASKISPIDTSQDYINTTPHTQKIWAAVNANGLSETTCLGLKQVANFVVEPLAILHPVNIPRQCDGDSANDSDAQDGLFPFDTSTVMSQLLLTQNPADYNITFYDQSDTVISTNKFPTEYLSPSQKVRVVVENKPSNVTPTCYQEAFFTFTVDDSPEIGKHNIPAVCDNDDGVLDNLGVFDTSNLNKELLAGQTNMEIQFLKRDAMGNDTVIGNSLPHPFTTETTTVLVQIYNTSNKNCFAEKGITFQVNENPIFDLPPTFVFCQNLGSDTISVTSPSDTYDYSWTLDGNPLPDTTQEIVIDKGGKYDVTATNPVTKCTTTKTVEVKPSQIALFDAEDITIYDLTGDGKNRVEIDNSEAALGIGDYVFALKLNDGPIGLYQDSPIFEDVPPGLHTLYVKDENGCGDVELEISVIGYPFYFTPNGDGQNDTWQILGVNASFQPSSLIYIFDRHGRLMAQIPADGIGWNGTYNGTIMPADDYWFRVKLQDGRSFTGHFSLVR
ncbi:MAG: T9SS type B sorting domain-containing protein [Bacteroidetes bacterium]|nr:T9SS type B sorting domain-containing protein [Bacteroidota bacterium]